MEHKEFEEDMLRALHFAADIKTFMREEILELFQE